MSDLTLELMLILSPHTVHSPVDKYAANAHLNPFVFSIFILIF